MCQWLVAILCVCAWTAFNASWMHSFCMGIDLNFWTANCWWRKNMNWFTLPTKLGTFGVFYRIFLVFFVWLNNCLIYISQKCDRSCLNAHLQARFWIKVWFQAPKKLIYCVHGSGSWRWIIKPQLNLSESSHIWPQKHPLGIKFWKSEKRDAFWLSLEFHWTFEVLMWAANILRHAK